MWGFDLSAVTFCAGREDEYLSSQKNSNCLYVCEDTGHLYKGPTRVSINVLDAYPVGSLYLTMSDNDPAQMFGGSWTRLDEGFLYSSSSLDSWTFRSDGVAISQNTRSVVPVYAYRRIS